MRVIFNILVCCFALICESQNQTTTALHFDEIVTIDTIELQLKSVIDSRCPKNVNCVRAGEAKVVVEIFKGGEFLKEQTLIFYPSMINGNMTKIYASGGLNISGVKLLPYPNGLEKIKEQAYFIEVLIRD